MMDPILQSTDLFLADIRASKRKPPKRWPWRGGRWSAPHTVLANRK